MTLVRDPILAAAPETADADGYHDAAQWQAERRSIFAKSWQLVGHASSLPEPGCWIADVVAGFPIVVVRGDAGELRGFHDVCRHRAGPLTDGPSGRCDGQLVCRYHGWRYAYDGRLRLARDFGPAAGFDPRDFSLFPIEVATWRGLVFVRLQQGGPSLAETVAPLERRLTGADWGDLAVALRRAHPIACNWKTYVENYLEGYHVPVLHPSLDAEIDSARYRVTMDGRVAIHEAPSKQADAVYSGLWAWLWPNLGVNVYGAGEGLMLERIAALGPRQTRLDYLYLTPAGAAPSEATLAMSDAVTAEDVWISEQVQARLEAGVYRTGRLSPRHENAVAAFQQMVAEALA